jgi:hypothetical protein
VKTGSNRANLLKKAMAQKGLFASDDYDDNDEIDKIIYFK